MGHGRTSKGAYSESITPAYRSRTISSGRRSLCLRVGRGQKLCCVNAQNAVPPAPAGVGAQLSGAHSDGKPSSSPHQQESPSQVFVQCCAMMALTHSQLRRGDYSLPGGRIDGMLRPVRAAGARYRSVSAVAVL